MYRNRRAGAPVLALKCELRFGLSAGRCQCIPWSPWSARKEVMLDGNDGSLSVEVTQAVTSLIIQVMFDV